MTNPTPLPVTQADREAAALVVVVQELREIVRAGRYDEHDYVQAFARHRLAEREIGIAQYWRRLGREEGAQSERERIVKWLRKMSENACFGKDYEAETVFIEAADSVERGEHMEANYATGE